MSSALKRWGFGTKVSSKLIIFDEKNNETTKRGMLDDWSLATILYFLRNFEGYHVNAIYSPNPNHLGDNEIFANSLKTLQLDNGKLLR